MELLIANKAIEGTSSFTLPSLPKVKFKRSNFKKIMRENEEFKEHFNIFLEEYLKTTIKPSSKLEFSKKIEEDFDDEVMSMDQEILDEREQNHINRISELNLDLSSVDDSVEENSEIIE